MASKVALVCLLQDGRKGAEDAVKEALMKGVPAFGSHLNTLAVIAGVAPLLGLLGTVTGMINLFEVITRFGTGDPKLLCGRDFRGFNNHRGGLNDRNTGTSDTQLYQKQEEPDRV